MGVIINVCVLLRQYYGIFKNMKSHSNVTLISPNDMINVFVIDNSFIKSIDVNNNINNNSNNNVNNRVCYLMLSYVTINIQYAVNNYMFHSALDRK